MSALPSRRAFLAAGLLWAGALPASGADPVTAREMLMLCGALPHPKPGSCPEAEEDALESLCTLRSQVGAGAADLTPFATLRPNPQQAVKQAVAQGCSVSVALAAQDKIKLLPSVTSKAAGLEGALLWGLGEFLVKRAKAELNAWLIDRLRKDVCSLELLPNTCGVMGQDVLSELGVGLTALRAALRKDLQALPASLARQVATAKCAGAGAATACDAAVTLSMVGSVAEEIARGEIPLAAVLRLPTRERIETWASQELSHERTRVADALLRGVLLLQTVAAVDANGVVRVERPGDVAEQQRFFEAMVQASFVNALQFYREQERTPVAWDAVLPIPWDSFQDAAATSDRIGPLLTAADEVRLALESFATVKGAADSTREARLRAFGLALEKVAQELEVGIAIAGFGPGSEELAKTVKIASRHAASIAHSLAAPDYGELVVELVVLAKDLGFGLESGKTARLLAFAADIAQAESAAAAESAIERLAAPAGSYKRKRSGRTYVTANAYVGGLAARERSPLGVDAKGDQQHDVAKAYSAWLPLGFEVGWGWKGHSFGLLVHALDVGALASYRASDPKSPIDSAPNVTFKQVFSPGLFALWGFKGCPLSVGLGISHSPQLRAIRGSGSPGAELHAGARRVGLIFALDIPLFP